MANTKRKAKSHLVQNERCQIQTLLESGKTLRKIAELLNISCSTVSRELQRNRNSKGYDFKKAHKKSVKRKSKSSEKPKILTQLVKNIISKEMLAHQTSPEQIAGRLRLCGIKISHKSIYNYIAKNRKMSCKLYKQLRHGGRKYRRKKEHESASSKQIPGRVDISERPEVVNRKVRVGDWEIDTIVGKNRDGFIVSLVDRVTKYVIFILIKKASAQNVLQAIYDALLSFSQKNLVKTITSDNGREFASHKKIAKKLDCKFYFARPYCSNDRGLNESINGLLRQYLPKGTSFSNITQEDVNRIAHRINNRPRKVLHFITPIEKLNQYLIRY
jgi:transposase, IS30 family